METQRIDEAARRQYWTTTFDEAWEFVQGLYRTPLEECGEEMVSLEAASRDAKLEVTFATRPHSEGSPRVFYLRRGLIEGFLSVARTMNDRGLALHVEDAYRTTAMQRGLWVIPSTFRTVLQRVRWERDGAPADEEFLYRRLAALVADCPRVGGHTSGAAIDIGVFRRDDRQEIDRGATYLSLGEVTPMASPFISAEARRNRDEITRVFAGVGMSAYPYEFWHYSRGDAYEAMLAGGREPARYGAVDADLATGQVAAMADPGAPLNSPEELVFCLTKAGSLC
jgi:zinc D-Ala-D-Ala dipeptidase